MAKIKKANRVITIDDSRVDSYLSRGYDQINEDGEVIKEATNGKTVTIAEYNKLKSKLKKVKENKDGVSQEEFDKLNDAFQEQAQERDELKEKAEKFAEKGKQLQEENEKLKKQLKKQ